MNRRILLALIFFIFITELLSAQTKDSVQGDFEALQDLYQNTNGPNWFNNTGWSGMAPENMGDAVGVTTDANGRVIELNMQSVTTDPNNTQIQLGNNLTGELPLSIGNLTKLEVLKLKTNKLTGTIPETIGNMVSLRYLSLGGQRCDLQLEDWQWNENIHEGCGLTGKNWEESNAFTGPIPASIGNLVNLEVFEARRQFLTGEIPPEIGNLTNLVALFLNDQQGGSDKLGGELPTEIGNLINLKHIHINGSPDNIGNFSGEIPSSVLAMSELRHIRLRANKFTGAFPIFDTYDLRVLTASENQFTGQFPIEYFQGKNANMSLFLIGVNNLSGDLPTNWSPPTIPHDRHSRYSPSKFSFGDNDFTGPIPDWMQGGGGTQTWFARRNKLTGPFPENVIEQPKVKVFMIELNELSGDLPDVPIASTRYTTFAIHANNFTGTIPDSWQTLTQSPLFQLFLNSNELEGPIPLWFNELQLSGSDRLRIHDNKFVFADILPIHDSMTNLLASGVYTWAPQKPFGNAQTIIKLVGESFTVDFSGKSHSNDTYQWFKDDVPISGETSPVLTIASVSNGDAGVYRLEINNPLGSEVDSFGESLGTLTSEPIELVIDDSSTDPVSPPSEPVLLTPADGSNGLPLSPLLEWGTVDNADGYRLQVSESSNFGQDVQDFQDVQDLSLQVTGLEYNTEYFWRVQAVNGAGTSDWSAVWSLTTREEPLSPPGVPDPASPGNGAADVSASPEISWNESVDAESYRLQVAGSSNFGQDVQDFQDVQDLSLQVTGLEYSTEYFWRVQAVNGAGTSDWSEVWSFTTRDEPSQPPAAPGLVSPANDATNVPLSLVFEWNEAENAESYTFQITSSGSTFSSGVTEFENLTETSMSLDGLEPFTVYNWRVKAVNGAGDSGWSDTWTFSTLAEQDDDDGGPGTLPDTDDGIETSIEQNYPNPFNPSTVIQFRLAEQQQVKLKIYNLAGQEVATLVNEALSAGTHERVFDAAGLASGIYFYRLITERNIFTKKMTLIK